MACEVPPANSTSQELFSCLGGRRLVSNHLTPRSFPHMRTEGMCVLVQRATSSGKAGGHPLTSTLGLLDLSSCGEAYRTLEPGCPSVNPSLATCQLCDSRQLTYPLCASLSSSEIGDTNSTPLGELCEEDTVQTCQVLTAQPGTDVCGYSRVGLGRRGALCCPIPTSFLASR